MTHSSKKMPVHRFVVPTLLGVTLTCTSVTQARAAFGAVEASELPAQIPAGKIWKLAGNVEVPESNFNNSGTLVVGKGATLVINDAGANAQDGRWEGNGQIDVTGGTIVLNQNVTLELANRLNLQAGTLIVSDGASLSLNKSLNASGGTVQVMPSGSFLMDGAPFTAANGEALDNQGHFRFANGAALSLSGGASAKTSGTMVIDNSTLQVGSPDCAAAQHGTVSLQEVIANSGTLSIQNGSTASISASLINMEKDGKKGVLAVTEGANLRLSGNAPTSRVQSPGLPVVRVTNAVEGGWLYVGPKGRLDLLDAGARVGSVAHPTDVFLDGTLHLGYTNKVATPGTPAATPVSSRRGRFIPTAVFPDASMYTLTGSLTTGSGTFSTTISQSGSNIDYGQMSIYGDVILNSGTLSVTKSPSTLNVVGINFDIIEADHIVRTMPPGSSTEPAFTSFSGAASTFDYKHVVPWPTPTPDPYLAVYRIKDSS